MKYLALALLASVLATTGGSDSLDAGASYLAARQKPDGGFGEPNNDHSDPALTAWVVLGLKAAGREPANLRRSGHSPAGYLADKRFRTPADLPLRILALRALGESGAPLLARLERLRRPNGRIGPFVNSTIWGVLALRAAGRPAGAKTIRFLLRQQTRSGGWSWHPRGAPDTNDTATAVQALRAAGIRGARIRRALAYLRRAQNPDGGFGLATGRASDAQSTAWAIQAFVAAGREPGKPAFDYLEGLRRGDGSFRYSRRYAITPAWVTAQVLPGLARKSFPLR